MRFRAVGEKCRTGVTNLLSVRAQTRSVAALVIGLSMAATLWFALARGQDFNWDHRNYHIGIPLLLASGRFWHSVAPAGAVSYLNPYVLQAQFWGLRHLSPSHFAVAIAILQSVAFMLAGAICMAIAMPAGQRWRSLLGLLGFGLCLMAPMALSEAGTTFIDLVTAVPVLAAYFLLLTRGERVAHLSSGLLAGALLGAAVALKLTNAVFVLGVLGFAVTGSESFRQRITWLPACAGAAAVAFVAIALPWDLTLWRHFGNPIFPFFNGIFHSPDFSPADFHDARYVAGSAFDIWLYPFEWMLPWDLRFAPRGTPASQYLSYTSSEVPYIDGRWFVLVVGITLFLAALAIRRRWAAQRLRDKATGLLLAFAIDYLAWLFVFDIGRYAVVLSILCGAAMLVLVMTLPSTGWRVAALALMVVAQGCVALVPNWGHVPWQPGWKVPVRPKLALGERPLVFLVAQPTLFLAASFPPDTLYVGVTRAIDLSAARHDALTKQVRQDLAWAGRGNLYAVDDGATSALAVKVLSSYGLHIREGCTPIQAVNLRLRICRLTDDHAGAAAWWSQGESNP